MASVDEETAINTIARWYHSRVHTGGKAWFCESDRKFAEDLLNAMSDWGWGVDENDRS